ncbi:hypothetical protein PtrSN002B_011328 [Pyrenophora tritici-repentis]|uniref:Uncharacterized protein n=1 Tax=Pyrenophora tritici-repentis TaxID=45151 RepID=A0A2W1DHB4_9PLEO|nr:hypothetical protein PtrV1_05026 [Pyrenophora tritici-repentis]KAF7452701.1 hypothetical protein A1F99_044790 [Pyrenophora tritici-repentis]KAF7574119.1 hypothetical protein PtrM4_057420 [Pyrenophora tritici-repentis]KAG9387053.1 hypothetical protein A1F94_003803 [Pyrenophora tritici-repentis]KAI0572058.1 hypothetical protein Alg215_10016 [Pyrenophora tritici-repentis]
MDYNFVHTLGECETFMSLLELLKEDTKAIPTITDVLARTKIWQMTFLRRNGTKKAIVARKHQEAAFNRLKIILSQAPIRNDRPNSKVDVELKSLS